MNDNNLMAIGASEKRERVVAGIEAWHQVHANVGSKHT